MKFSRNLTEIIVNIRNKTNKQTNKQIFSVKYTILKKKHIYKIFIFELKNYYGYNSNSKIAIYV